MKHLGHTKSFQVTCIAALLMVLLVGCGGGQPAPTATPVDVGGDYTSEYLDTSYDQALNVSSQLAVGTVMLEETEHAVTAVQAATLLPLWQAIQSGTLQSEDEINAVLKQVEGTMTPEQLQAIAALQLTFEDQGTWAESQGLTLGQGEGRGQIGKGGQMSPEARATLQAQLGNMSEEQRQAMRATAQAGGQGFGGQGFGDISEEQRQAVQATAEASGMGFDRRGFGGGTGQLSILLDPLIELLTERAKE